MLKHFIYNTQQKPYTACIEFYKIPNSNLTHEVTVLNQQMFVSGEVGGVATQRRGRLPYQPVQSQVLRDIKLTFRICLAGRHYSFLRDKEKASAFAMYCLQTRTAPLQLRLNGKASDSLGSLKHKHLRWSDPKHPSNTPLGNWERKALIS